jgi:hypothetical protein
MDEPQQKPLDRLDFRLIVGLMLVTLVLRLWQVTHTEVLARDSIGFIRMAYEIEQYGWKTAIAGAEQHPGFPLVILAVRQVGGDWLGDDLPHLWQLAAQVASSLASILLVLPVYLIGRRLFNPTVAGVSVLLVQCLPALGRLFGDGLTEATFLLFAGSAFWATFRAFDTRHPGWFLAIGIFSGLAYYVRPEGLFVAVSAGLVLLGCQCLAASRQAWRTWLAQGACLGLATLLLVGLFVLATGKVTLKPTANNMMREMMATESAQVFPQVGGPLLADWWEGDTADRSQRVIWAAELLGRMLIRGTFHVGWVFGLLALWWYRDRLRLPAVLVMGLTCGVIGYLLYRVAWFLGYLSDRHLALILLAFAPFIAAGLIEAGRRSLYLKAWMPAVLVLALLLPATYRTLLPLHYDRQGFREAGEWLADNTNPGDFVFDPFCWTHYYAGRVFVEKQAIPGSQPPVEYVLMEKGTSEHLRLKAYIAEATKKIERGQLVRTWDIRRGKLEVWAVPK